MPSKISLVISRYLFFYLRRVSFKMHKSQWMKHTLPTKFDTLEYTVDFVERESDTLGAGEGHRWTLLSVFKI